MWLADLTTVADGGLLELLSPEERARAARLVRERDRQLWTRAHGVFRELVGRYLASDPRALRFTSGAHGKPMLLERPPRSTNATDRVSVRPTRLSFNMSHSGLLALYAFTAKGAIGVDVEVARRPIDELAVAARVFGPDETRRLAALGPVTRKEEFLRAWVRHEAEWKCLGTGIGSATADVQGPGPWIAELEVGPRAAAAVAVERPPRELRCWGWQG